VKVGGGATPLPVAAVDVSPTAAGACSGGKPGVCAGGGVAEGVGGGVWLAVGAIDDVCVGTRVVLAAGVGEQAALSANSAMRRALISIMTIGRHKATPVASQCTRHGG